MALRQGRGPTPFTRPHATAALLAGVLLTGCAGAGSEPRGSGGASPRPLLVPAGQHPPPGHCRLWYPGRPPGRQPAPAPCAEIVVVPGTFLLYEGRAWDVDHDWRAYARRYPGMVPSVVIEVTTRR